MFPLHPFFTECLLLEVTLIIALDLPAAAQDRVCCLNFAHEESDSGVR